MNGNSIGVDRQRRPVGGTSSTGISISGYASTAYAFIGPNNVITGREYAVTVFSPTVVQVAQNSIWGNTNGIASTVVCTPIRVHIWPTAWMILASFTYRSFEPCRVMRRPLG